MKLHRLLRSAAAIHLLAAAAVAAPSGEQVVLGDVTFHRDGSVTVIQASDGAVIHYDSFDIFAHETVQFLQPDDQARVLNRVSGPATHIDGTLLANGIVYIVNPLGVFVGDQAEVQVRDLVLAGGDIANEDFLAGVDRFELSGPVVNESGDVHAQAVKLVGTRVENLGEIHAPEGTIALVAGERVVLARIGGRVMVEVEGGAPGGTGVQQAGLVDAGGGQAILAAGDHYSLAINHEGVTRGADVEIRGGDDGVVLVKGEVDASSADGRGGDIRVTGERVALLGATLDASGGAGGGSIRVGGDVRGGGDLETARRVYVDARTSLVADATQAGDGGSVVVWGDEAAVVDGAISARGGAAGGDGGFAEISSQGLLDSDADVDLGADAGQVGTLLYDPQDIVIVGGTDDGSDDPDASENVLNDGTLGEVLFIDVGDGSTPFEIFESEIEETNANIVLEATNSIGVSGTFDHETDAEGAGVVVISDGRNLTMRTRNNTDDELGSAATPGIDLGDIEWRTSGGGGIGMSAGGTGAAADIAVGDLTTVGGGGDINLQALDGSITTGDLTTAGADGTTANGAAGGNILLSASGSVTAGDIDTTGGDALVTSSNGVGGRGGDLRMFADDGDVSAGAIDVSGGDGGMQNPSIPGVAGDAGTVDIDVGREDVDTNGSIILTGAFRAMDGEGGTPFSDSGGVSLQARDAVEFEGVAGPQITTSEELTLRGATVGAVTPIEVESDGTLDKTLRVAASDTAQVDVTTAGFSQIILGAEGNEADLDITQAPQKPGGNGVTIEIDGAAGTNTIQRIDTFQDPDAPDDAGTPVGIVYQLFDDLTGDDDVTLEAVVASGAITTGGFIQLLAEDDIVLEDDAIAMHEVLDPARATQNPPLPIAGGQAGVLQIVADDDGDGVGAILAGGAGTAIDMDPDAADIDSALLLLAASGIGTSGAPIQIANVDDLAAGLRTSGGIFVRQVAGGDLALAPELPFDPFEPDPLFLNGDAVAVADGGAGDIEITNDAGDLLVRGDVRSAGDGTTGGGSIELAATQADALVRFLGLGGSLVDAADDVTIDGDVGLGVNTDVEAGGDVTFTGAVDSDGVIGVVRDLSVESDGVVRFGGDVGSQLALRNLGVAGATELTQDTSFTVIRDAAFAAVDAAADDAAALTVAAGTTTFFGNLGAGGRLRGVDLDSDTITFESTADQSVEAGADGIALNSEGLGAPPAGANIGKLSGDLSLTTTGTLAMGPNQKLTVDGTAELSGATVIVGDVSAQAIEVQSPDFQVQAREGADFLRAGGSRVPDAGVDLIADTISTTSAPVVTGTGNTPIFATLSGQVDGAGAGSAQVLVLSQPVASADLVDVSNPAAPVFFDLGIAITDPGHETPIAPPPVAALDDPRPGEETAGGSALPPGPDAMLAFLRCTEEKGEGGARQCAPARGSPLDSARGEEIAERYARLFGPSAEAESARRLLAGPDSPERQAVMRDLVTLLAQIRLLGLDQASYERVRDQLLDAVGGSRDALLADVRANARGIPL